MSLEEVEGILGIALSKLEGIPEFFVYCELGEGVEFLGRVRGIEEALGLIRQRAFGWETPGGKMNIAQGNVEDPGFEELGEVLGEGSGLERTMVAGELVYMAEVLEERADLRLVVAWEAAPPLQDVAFGIFAPKSN